MDDVKQLIYLKLKDINSSKRTLSSFNPSKLDKNNVYVKARLLEFIKQVDELKIICNKNNIDFNYYINNEQCEYIINNYKREGFLGTSKKVW